MPSTSARNWVCGMCWREVERSGRQLRVNAQLIDAQIGAHLWAERFDRDTGDLFALQNEITGLHRRRARYRADRRGGGAAERAAGRARLHPAGTRRILEVAHSGKIHRDDRLLRARAGAGSSFGRGAEAYWRAALANRALDFMTDTTAADLARAEALLSQVLLAAPRNPRVHYARAELLRVFASQPRGDPRISRRPSPPIAIGLTPWRALAGASSGSGRWKRRFALHEEAMRLSPRDPLIGYWYFRIGLIRLLQSRTDEAFRGLRRREA